VDRLELIGEMRLLEAEHDRVRQIAQQLPKFCVRTEEHTPCTSCGSLLVSQCANAVTNSLVVLQSFSTMHFAHEETIMRMACPGHDFEHRFGAHIADHAALTAQLARISNQQSSTSPASMIGELAQLVQHWLRNHMASHDEALTLYLESSCR
jgi:hemerythrin-like metal-binding protein